MGAGDNLAEASGGSQHLTPVPSHNQETQKDNGF